MGTIQIDGSTPKLTIGNATAEDALILFDGNAQDFYIGLDDSSDDLIIGLGSAVGTTPAISINEDRDVTISDGAIDFDVASHDGSNGLKLAGTLVTTTAAELNILDGSAKSTSSITVADADGIIIIDGTTTKQIPASDLKTYAGFTATTITGTTALATQPASTDEIILSDAGTLKRMDIKHIQNTPAFVAYNADTQSGVSDNTRTKVAFTEVLDTDTAYASDTTFTPGVAGYYFLTAQARAESSDASAAYSANIVIYKNGSEIPDAGGGKMFIDGGSHALAKRFSITCNTVVYLDSDDYVELYIGMDTNNVTVNIDDDGHFSGFRIAGV